MKQYHNRPILLHRRRELRRKATAAEDALWALLKNKQLYGRKFRRQHSVGPYILDFYCPAERLCVEVDGPIHDHPHQMTHDTHRTAFLNKGRIKVIRIRNEVVLKYPQETLGYIASFFSQVDPR